MYESYSIWPKGKRKHFDSHQNGYVYEYSWTSRATRRICARTGPLFSLINIHWRSCRLRHVHIWLWQCNVPPICFIGIAYFEEIVNDDGFQLTGPDCAPTPRCIDRKAHSATNLFPELNKQTIKKEKNPISDHYLFDWPNSIQSNETRKLIFTTRAFTPDSSMAWQSINQYNHLDSEWIRFAFFLYWIQKVPSKFHHSIQKLEIYTTKYQVGN